MPGALTPRVYSDGILGLRGEAAGTGRYEGPRHPASLTMNDALTLAAAAFVGLATPARGGERPALAAAKAVRPPTIDGQIDPDEWKNAAVARGLRQLEPRRGEAATTDTEALVLYDERSLYVVFRAADDQEPTAQLTQRDADLCSSPSRGAPRRSASARPRATRSFSRRQPCSEPSASAAVAPTTADGALAETKWTCAAWTTIDNVTCQPALHLICEVGHS